MPKGKNPKHFASQDHPVVNDTPEAIQEFKDQLTPGSEESLSLQLNSQAEVPHFTKFDRFRLSQDFHEYAGVKKLLTTVPVKKPNKQQFVRTRLEEGYVLDVLLLEFGENKET